MTLLLRSITRTAPCALLLLASLLACGGGEPTPPRETHGVLRVVTVTSGQELDQDGYALMVGEAAPVTLPASGVTHVAALLPGSHALGISGIASNCTLAGTAARSEVIAAGDTTITTFTIACERIPTTGTIVVRTRTTGSVLDPDGFTFALDGGTPQAIGLNAEARFTEVAPGAHTVALAGVASNCQLTGTAERGFNLGAGDSLVVTYDVACADPGQPNTVVIRTITTGDAPDTNGYAIVGQLVPPSGRDSLRLGVNDSLALGPYPPDTWVYFDIKDVAGHCRGPVAGGAQVREDGAVRDTLLYNCWNSPPACRSLQIQVSSGTTPVISWTGGCPVYRLSVYQLNVPVDETFLWVVDAPFGSTAAPTFGPVAYGTTPSGMQETRPRRPLVAGREYFIELAQWYLGTEQRTMFRFTP